MAKTKETQKKKAYICLKNSKERVKQYRLRQKELGRLKREMYLTDIELELLKFTLAEFRKSE